MPTINGTNGNDTLTGTPTADTMNGLGGNDTLHGADGDDIVNGDAGYDTLYGDDGNDQLYGGSDNDDLYGGAGDDYLDAGPGYPAGFSDPQENLYGGDGNDTMTGGAGQNMYGGTGDDVYYVNQDRGFIGDFDYIIPEDRVFELDGEGTDTIRSTLGAYTITDSQSIEILILEAQTSSSIRQLGGNVHDNMLIGNDSANTLEGNGGNDVVYGMGGDDDLLGGDGNDVIVGGAGNDRMTGGAGSDTYYVTDAGDVLIEPAAVGDDRVAATVSYALGADADIELFEAITQSATNALDFTGNDFSQTIVGNDGVNRLDAGGGTDILYGLGGADTLIGGAGDDVLAGGSGADSMDGGAGSDTYYVDDAGDVLIDPSAAGVDRVAAAVSYALGADVDIELLEAITLSSTDPLNFTGNGFGQEITGNNGANVLDGKSGADVLIGLAGADTFAFTTALGSFNIDRIADFVSGTDKIALDDALFTGLAPGALSANAFTIGSAAGDADDRIIYNSATGALYFDADGNGAGAAIQFGTLDHHPALTESDFMVI